MSVEYKKAMEYIERIYEEQDDPKRLDYVARVSRNDFGSPITDEAARLFKTLIHLVRPKRILEIGTSIGFSTTSMALAARTYGGRITTLEIDSSWAEITKNIFSREGVSDVIDIIVGDASETIKDFEDETFDIVFQDSAKPLYPVMLDDCIRVLRKGGLFLVDNTLFPVRSPKEKWSDSLSKIHDFNEMLLKMPVQSTILPIGTGCTVAVKL
ncbi:MAG: O-methyltransferase [Candidatus Thorarchaeota archaeon]|nr:MAG: O-methyltransferase [Candidatus Thorarchaeota archaeon]